MEPPLPCPTPTWRYDTYDAISPARRALNMAGKTVVIAGGGSRIGRETAVAYAQAGAARVALLGRHPGRLLQTVRRMPQTTVSEVYLVDLCDEARVRAVARLIGLWDVLIITSGYATPACLAFDTPTDMWWKSFEVNVKGTYILAKSFMNCGQTRERPCILALTSGPTALPPETMPMLSGYISSRIAQTKLMEFVTAENPYIFAASVHPGMTETIIRTRHGEERRLPMDQIQLPAHFLLWLASEEADFLNGRCVWANWDVTQLKDQAANIVFDDCIMKTGVNGWPYKRPASSNGEEDEDDESEDEYVKEEDKSEEG